ncbi:DNA processing protein DprA [Elizabethkingia anophelis]|uniref:Rossmann fold nucleotide-binding protein Smf n=1 Tax=Elizabethkingia anophelis TaxID=1117645 RepID=A0A455ZF97_9FLAO|nr:DNA-processing protein DprA [Elizabethkingia anophelis]AQW94916.1 DNA processing protein DprA [Elizabethkingia anophelis]MCL1689643.1 DNA-protecting protein DprA [Elizabethkingia anophelis]MDV3856190.1 DNA processing protein DprA [Elizabethkingia anophelis]MDV3860892.1 DNA processing protein DprA [Elizabethkingia anophelis]MDV3909340.1 DNA processing protein DprA [Elizabethkingia anophelis]
MTAFQEYYSKLTEVEKKNSPKELFFMGDFSLLESERRIAVVGSRKVSAMGVRRAEFVTKFLVERNIVVVSGLAEGIDTTAHTTAIVNGGKTIAVIGTPLNISFPASNKGLQDIIGKEHLLISQFKENTAVSPKNFPIRNRTMAMISDATIIIEASENSGTRHQGWEALRLGRNLYIMENIIKDKKVTWAREMLDYGAQILTKENYKDTIDDTPYLTAKVDYAF